MSPTVYFQAYQNYFWHWEDDTEVVTIQGGSTIAYKAHLAMILSNIAPQGLPPFGSFLLAVIATNNTMDNVIISIEMIIKKHCLQYNLDAFVNSEDFLNTFLFLQKIKELDSKFKVGKRKEILLRTLFATAHNLINAKTAMGIASSLMENKRYTTRLQNKLPFNEKVLYKDFKTISLLHRRFPTTQSIIDSMGDLPELEEEDIPLLEEDTKANVAYENFVEQLIDHPKTFEIGALIKPIWAGFNVPIFSAHPSEQPLGGVSDIANKGNFDKLLVSEFANDDLVFISRVANNEALYLHREIPPVTDNLQRIILIDISLNSWGTPKTLGFATYVAIARHPKSKGDSIAYVVGNSSEAVTCQSMGELIDALQKVDIGLHSGIGLNQFLQENKSTKKLEIFYITTAECLQFPEIQKVIADYNTSFKYIITTNIHGEIAFYRNKNNAKKHLQTIHLPLDKLWVEKKKLKSNSKIEPMEDNHEKSYFPILLPTQKEIRKIIPLGDTVFCVTNKRLLKRSMVDNTKNTKGWELILEKIAANGIYEIGETDNGELLYLCFDPQNRDLNIYNLRTKQKASTTFKEWKGRGFKEFLFYNGQFIFLVSNPSAYAFEPNFITGEIEYEKKELSSQVFYNEYPNRQKQIKDFPPLFFNTNIYRNIDTIYINKNQKLVFNSRQLNIGYSNNLEFIDYDSITDKEIVASQTSKKREFGFAEGSKIEIDFNGLIILKSSNENLPPIYFTSFLDTFLSMATEGNFAGNSYYYKENLTTVLIEKIGGRPLEAIKIVKKYSGLGLSDAKNLIDNAPMKIPVKINYLEAVKMQEELEKINCVAKISDSNAIQQEIISTERFYQIYFDTFIKHIIENAATNKTK